VLHEGRLNEELQTRNVSSKTVRPKNFSGKGISIKDVFGKAFFNKRRVLGKRFYPENI